MYPFNLYPYTNFQELNLDYLLQAVKQLEAAVKALDPTADVEAVIQEMIDNGDFANIVDETLLKDKVNKHATKIYAVGWYNNTSSVNTMDCLIAILDGKVMVIDAGAEPVAAEHPAVTLMSSLGITKVDYIYISHYHEDHVGGFSKLVSGIDCTGAKAFIAKAPSNIYDTPAVVSAYNSVIADCASHSIQVIYPSENEDFKLTEKEHITFFNTDPTIYYSDSPYNYNDCSLCAALYSSGTPFWFDGDLQESGQAHLAATGIPTCIGKKIAHHGTSADGDSEYFRMIAPYGIFATNAYGRSTDGSSNDFLSAWSYETSWAEQNDVPVFSTSAASGYVMVFEFGDRLLRPLTPRYRNDRIGKRNTSTAAIFRAYTDIAKTKSFTELLDAMNLTEYVEFNAETTWALCPSILRDGCLVQVWKNCSANSNNSRAEGDGLEFAYVTFSPHKHGGKIYRMYTKESGSWSYVETHEPGAFMFRDGQTLSNDGTTITSDIDTITSQIGDSFAIESGKLTCKDYGFYEFGLYTTNQGTVGDHYFNAMYRNRSGTRTKIAQLDNNINYSGENYEYAGSNPIALNPGDTIEFDHNGTGNVWFRFMVKKIGFR